MRSGDGVDDSDVANEIDEGNISLSTRVGLAGTGTISNTVLSTAVAAGSASFMSFDFDTDTGYEIELPLTVDTAGINGLDLPSLPTITISSPELPSPFDFSDITAFFGTPDIDLPDLTDLFSLANISLQDVFDSFSAAIDGLFGAFTTFNLPGLNLSLDEVFGDMPSLSAFFDNLFPTASIPDISLLDFRDWFNTQPIRAEHRRFEVWVGRTVVRILNA